MRNHGERSEHEGRDRSRGPQRMADADHDRERVHEVGREREGKRQNELDRHAPTSSANRIGTETAWRTARASCVEAR